ncbi:hypothetical protein HSB1_36700 [Halogranum salarium B-1]|uniref:Uncharacterized protein n=1 Tax=Halogranum salarium B-1 TaxID=1210908 RepID=J2ZYZ8_9EURY|nr:hypothetical protein HSB1_36700 [Halogranum salarium B-1]
MTVAHLVAVFESSSNATQLTGFREFPTFSSLRSLNYRETRFARLS